MAGTYLGDTWIEDPAEPIQPQDAIMADPKNAAAVAALLAQYGPLGKLSSVHIGDSQYSNEWNGRSLQNSKYGLYSGGEGGNVIWDGSNWVPVPDAGGSLFGDFIGDIAKFGGAALGAYGLASGLGGLLGSAGAAGIGPGTISAADASAAMGSGVDAAGWGSGALDVLGAAETAGAGLYPWLDAAGNLDVTKFLELTGPGGEYASAIPGGAEGIAAMDTLGSTSWLESAVNSLKHGDTSWLTSSVSPTQIKSVLSKVLGGESTPAKTGTAKTAAGAAGGAGGINIFNTGGDDSGLADAMKIFSGGRSGMDSVVQAMSQSGKGN